MSTAGVLYQLVQSLLVVAAAPLLAGWVNACRAWLQNRSAPSVTQPYRVLRKLFRKDATLAHNASWLFWFAPYAIFGCMWLAAGIVPVLATDLPFAPAADVIALVGIFAVARVFISLAAMDIGTAFGTLGARREMLIGALAEPALLIVFFNLSLISQSTSLTTIVGALAHRELALYPSLAFAGVAFVMVLLAENARIPVDNPATHLELTMVHEALILEYSARHLALIEWAAAIKLFVYCAIGIACFLPWGIARAGDWSALPFAIIAAVVKLMIAGAGLAVLETVSAKMRIFRVPEFVATAFMLAMLGLLLQHVIEVCRRQPPNAKDARDAKEEKLTEDEIGRLVVGSALKVHSALGAGLLESVYEACLAYELVKQELHIEQQFPCPIVYEGLKIDGAFRLDLLLEKKVVLEIKAVERILPVHGAQLLSYLKLGNYKLGFLLNFNVVHMKDGIKRIVNNL